MYKVRFSLKRIRDLKKTNPKAYAQMIREAKLLGGTDDEN